MKAQILFEAGNLDGAIEALGADLRDDPTNVHRRTFLFELLCFAGQYDRAEKQLDVIARSHPDAELGAWLYRSALHGERIRQEMFSTDSLSSSQTGPPAVAGTLNGQPFQSLVDADPRIGARLEVLAAGQYTWIPFESIAAVRIEAPKRLRDLLWIPARVQTNSRYSGVDLGEVLLPVLAPLTWENPDGEIRLGRVSDWVELPDDQVAPVGQKLLLLDDEPFPILEVRDLEIHSPD